MNKTSSKLTKNTNNKTYTTQKEVITNYLRKKSRSKMTTEEICMGINSTYSPSLTIPQVSQCLSRLNGTIVNKHEDGLTSGGRKVLRWSYLAPANS